MLHTLKKYTSNRGAALFMVISTMTALLVSCMAMYFSMVSSRQAQYTVFNQIQASQTSQSIMNVVVNGLMEAGMADFDGSGPKAATQLYNAIKDLNVGESISTDANGFASLDPNMKESLGLSETANKENNLGAYAVTITAIGVDDDGDKIYDITVMSSVNGSRDVMHQTGIQFKKGLIKTGGGKGAPGDSELFAATGYVPNDAYLDGGFYLTNTFFDTEFTYVGQYDNKANFLAGNIATGGSLIFQTYLQSVANESGLSQLKRPTTWSIRGNFENNWNGPIQLMGDSKIMVGCDASFVKSGAGMQAVDGGNLKLYVLGDLYISNSVNFTNTDVYVAGSILNGNSGAGQMSCSNFYVNGTVNIPSITGHYGGSWDWTTTNDSKGKSIEEVEEELGQRTMTQAYYKWTIGDDLVNAAHPIKIELNDDLYIREDVQPLTSTFTLAYPGSESDKNGTANHVGKGFTIDGFKGKDTANNVPLSVIIDTGDDPDNIIAIRVKPYIDQDGDGIKETFAWRRSISSATEPLGIIVKGRGSVIIDIDKGTIYQESMFQQMMNYGWFVMLGGDEGIVEKDCEVFGPLPWDPSTEALHWEKRHTHYYSVKPIVGGKSLGDTVRLDATAASFIHTNCIYGDGCSYTTAEETNPKLKCKACGGVITNIICGKHGKVDSYCAACQEYKTDKLTAFKNADGTTRVEGFCSNHLDHALIDAYLSTHSDANNAMKYKDKNAETKSRIYPNTNIYLVSIDESSEVRFSEDLNGNDIKQNGFFGYVYTPYLTYKAKGTSGLGTNRFLGGMIVSDYIINDTYAFTACYPDKMPNEIAALGGGNIAEGLGGKVTKTWKVIIGSYT